MVPEMGWRVVEAVLRLSAFSIFCSASFSILRPIASSRKRGGDVRDEAWLRRDDAMQDYNALMLIKKKKKNLVIFKYFKNVFKILTIFKLFKISI